jgi:hypothetical protein
VSIEGNQALNLLVPICQDEAAFGFIDGSIALALMTAVAGKGEAIVMGGSYVGNGSDIPWGCASRSAMTMADF